MARKRSKPWLTLIFVLVVAQIGLMIEASGHMRDPFHVFTELRTLRLDFSVPGGISNQAPPSIAVQTPIAGVTFVDNTFGEIRWSEFRSVLFDWWFIAAVTAFVIVVGRPIGLLIKRLRLALKPA